MISSSAQFPGPDVAECTFPGPDALTSEFPGVDFAVVLFPPAPMPIIEGIAHFTGAGYFTVNVSGIAKVAALFSASGNSAADVTAWGGVKDAAADFTGVGDFAVVARAVQQGTYSGSGSLAAQIATALAADSSGSGQAEFTSSAIGIAPFTLNGEGTATATVVAVGGAYAVSVNFTGEGSATAVVTPSIAAGFNGSGLAAATVASAIKSLFNGSGTSAANVVSVATASFTGSGTTSATMVPGFNPSGMLKSGTFATSPSSTPVQVTGWGGDPAYPGSTVTSNALVASGTKTATVEATVVFTRQYFNQTYKVEVRRGSTVLASQTVTAPANTGTYTVSITPADIAVTSGDQLTVWASATGFKNTVIEAGTFIHIT